MVEEKRKISPWLFVIYGLIVLIVVAYCLMLPRWTVSPEYSEDELALRQQFVQTAEKYLGANEADGSHKPIIDRYNSHLPLALNYKVRYTDAWCATFVSAVAIECGLTDIIPTECGCQRQIELFKGLNAWEENDNYIPSSGDIIFYAYSGKEGLENTGWSDHVGIVVSVEQNQITVIEGNCNHRVDYRTVPVGHKWIRGYGLPNFASKI